MKDLLNFEDVSDIDRLAMILALKRIVEKESDTNVQYLFHYPNELNQDSFYKIDIIDTNTIDYYFNNDDESLDELQSNFMSHINNPKVDYIVLPLSINYVDVTKEYIYLLIFDKKYIGSSNLWIYTLDIFYEDNFSLNKILNHFVRSLNVRDDIVLITNTEKDLCPQTINFDKIENTMDFCVQWMFYFCRKILDNKNYTLESVTEDMRFMIENNSQKLTKFMYKLIFETVNVIFDYKKELDEKNDVLILSFNIYNKDA